MHKQFVEYLPVFTGGCVPKLSHTVHHVRVIAEFSQLSCRILRDEYTSEGRCVGRQTPLGGSDHALFF